MTRTTFWRGLALVVAATLAVTAAVTLARPTVGEAAASTTYSLTLAGTDARSLDVRVGPQFIDGGGVQPMLTDGTSGPARYLEMGLDLPVGAKVTSVAITYSGSFAGGSDMTGTYTFGSYAPASRATQQVFSVHPPSAVTPKTTTRTGNPITTVVAGRRYAIDWAYATANGGRDVDPNLNTWYGATVKYTCSAPCVP